MVKARARKREQAAVVPYRVRRGRIEIALITTNGRGRWIVPKGGIDKGESPSESAERETREEAGLLGELHEEPLGRYAYTKACARCVVEVFLMRVTHELDSWLEDDVRRRRWFALKEAARRVRAGRLRSLLLSVESRIQES